MGSPLTVNFAMDPHYLCRITEDGNFSYSWELVEHRSQIIAGPAFAPGLRPTAEAESKYSYMIIQVGPHLPNLLSDSDNLSNHGVVGLRLKKIVYKRHLLVSIGRKPRLVHGGAMEEIRQKHQGIEVMREPVRALNCLRGETKYIVYADDGSGGVFGADDVCE